MKSFLQALGSITNGAITNNEMLVKSFASLTPNKIADIAATNGLSQSTLTATLKSAGYTKQQRAEVYQQYNTIKAKQAATAATQTQTAATSAATAAAGGFTAALRGLWTAFTAFVTTPIGTISAIAVAFLAAKIAADKFGLTAKGAAERFDEAKSAFSEVSNELETLSSELETTKKRIEELNQLASTARLTPDQEIELAGLKATNEELQRKYDIQKKLADAAQNDVETAAVNKYRRTHYDSVTRKVSSDGGSHEISVKLRGADYIHDLMAAMTRVKDEQAELDTAFANGTITNARYKQEMSALTKEYGDYEAKLSEVIPDMQEIAESIDDTKGPLSYMKTSILEAIDAWLLFDSSEQEVLERMKTAANGIVAAEREVARNAKGSESGKNAADILTYSIERFKTSFNGYIAKAIEFGYVSDDSTESILKLANALQTIDDTDAPNWSPDLTSHISSLKTVEENINSLSEVLEEFRDEGIVSYKTLEGLVEVFGSLPGNEFESFVKTAADSGSSLDEVRTAVNDLAAAYLNSTEFLNSLTEETAKSTIASLEHLGVTNAKTVVTERLAVAQLEATLKSVGLAEATWESAEQHLRASGAAETYISALNRLRQEQYNTTLSSVDLVGASSSVITALISQGEAAGVAADNLAKLSRIDELQDYVIDGRMSKAEYAEAVKKLTEEAKADVSAFKTELSLPNFNINVKYPKSTNKNTAKEKETDKNKEAFEEKYNAMKHELDMEKITIEQFYAWLNGNDGYKKHFSDRAKYADEWRKYEKECYDLECQITTEAFNEKYNTMKHELDMEKITLEQFYSWLNGDDGYKKYFSDLARYADEWRKYEKECLDYRKQLAEDSLNAIDDEISALERQEDSESLIIAKYKEKQGVIKDLMDAHVAYLRAIGASEDAIANNDYIAELLKQWWAIQDTITDTTNTINNELADGLETILDMTIAIVKKEMEDEIDSINELKDEYSDIIAQRREILRLSEQERQYNDEKNEKLRQLEKIEARLATLGRDDSREARLEEASLQEEKYELQKELNDLQNNHWLDAAEAKLDEELEKWEDTQDAKIDKLEDFVNDELKLRAEAISRLENMDDKLYDTLLDHAVNYCDMSRYEFQKLWDDALAAAEKYGSFVGAMDFLPAGDKETEASSIIAEMNRNRAAYAAATSDSERTYYDNENLRLGAELAKVTGRNVYRDRNGYWWIDDQYLFDYGLGTGNENSSVSRKNAAKVSDIVNNMKEYGKKWNANDPNRGQIHEVVAEMADSLERYGVYTEYDSASGKWIITKDNNNPTNKNKWLYQVYHQGGVAGGYADLRQREILAKLEVGEMILTKQHQENLARLIDSTKPVWNLGAAFASVAGKLNGGEHNNINVQVNAPLSMNSDISDAKFKRMAKENARYIANEITRVITK